MSDDKFTRSDMKRLEHAARQRWEIPDAVREAAITRLAMIIADPKQRPRMHAAAIRALAELDKLNVAQEYFQERRAAAMSDSTPTIVQVVTRPMRGDREALERAELDADPSATSDIEAANRIFIQRSKYSGYGQEIPADNIGDTVQELPDEAEE